MRVCACVCVFFLLKKIIRTATHPQTGQIENLKTVFGEKIDNDNESLKVSEGGESVVTRSNNPTNLPYIFTIKICIFVGMQPYTN